MTTSLVRKSLHRPEGPEGPEGNADWTKPPACIGGRALNAGADTRPDTRPLDLAGSVVAAIGPLKGKRVIEVNPGMWAAARPRSQAGLRAGLVGVARARGDPGGAGPGVMSRQLLAQGPERVLALEEHRRFDETLQVRGRGPSPSDPPAVVASRQPELGRDNGGGPFGRGA